MPQYSASVSERLTDGYSGRITNCVAGSHACTRSLSITLAQSIP